MTGYLQVDGYAGYEKTHATLVGCWAHARRKFVEAQKAKGKGKTGKADVALNHIQKLYALESKLKTVPPDKKYEARQTLAKPLLEQFKSWLDKSSESVTKEGLLGAAITYSLNQWPKWLIAFSLPPHYNLLLPHVANQSYHHFHGKYHFSE